MFYSDSILARKGPLANIWLAANWDRKLTRGQILQTDLASTVDDLVNGEHPPMALRLQGQLLLGVSKIYGRQARYLLDDCGEALGRLQEHSVASAKALPATKGVAAPATALVKRGAVVPLDRIPEFNVEDFLKTVKPALATPSTPQKRAFPEGEEEEGTPSMLLSPEMGMLVSPQANAELLQVLNMSPSQDLTQLNMLATSPGQAIEVGRRQSEAATALPLSPLRSPQFEADEQPQQFDDDNYQGEAAMLMGSESSAVPDPQSMLVSPPATKSAKRTRRNVAPKRPAVFDEETELEGNQPSLPTPTSTKVHNTRAKKATSAQSLMDLLSKPMSGDDAFAELFQEIALSSPLAKKTIDRLDANDSDDEVEGQMDHENQEMDYQEFAQQEFDDDRQEFDNQDDDVHQDDQVEEPTSKNTLMELLASGKIVRVQRALADMHATKRQAAHLFFELLAKDSAFAVHQSSPFGEIEVTLL